MSARWPELDWPAWRETAQHLHLITQIVGKVRLTCTPWLNHGWHVALYVTPRGLTTGPIPHDGRQFQIDLDMREHAVRLTGSDGKEASISLTAGSIADIHAAMMEALAGIGVAIRINTMPSELPDAIRFDADTQMRPYDPAAVEAFHAALLAMTPVFARYRTGFLGKASPVHFFWGSFDLAVTLFSGRTAPRHPGGVPGLPDPVTCEAYSHEEASAGFWPGSDAYPRPAFYAYAYPAPEGYADAAVKPDAARWDAGMGEFLLDYDAVCAADDPEGALLDFLQSTYAAAANLGDWDRERLECPLGVPRQPRIV